jgi:hypothetical protein
VPLRPRRFLEVDVVPLHESADGQGCILSEGCHVCSQCLWGWCQISSGQRSFRRSRAARVVH